MRGLERNKQTFQFAAPTGKRVPVLDENGNLTGAYETEYAPKQEWKGNVSAGTGEVEAAPFGSEVSYDRIIVLAGEYPPIGEFYRVWFQGEPYIVKKVAISLNGMSIAIRKVDVRV